MIELKVKDPQAFMNVVEVLNANGHEVKTYVQWGDKVGDDILYFIVKVPGIAVMTPDKPGVRLSRVPKRTQQAIERLGRNSYD